MNKPIGTIPMWCDSTGNCYITPPSTPNKPGIYTWCVKALDTATGLNSEPCVMDTVTILPVVSVKNLTLMNTVATNPTNISGLVNAITTGSYPKWCDVNGNNCSTTAPSVPNKPGIYVWCVKAVDSATLLQSASCVMDTLTILDPYQVLDITKETKSIHVNLDGSVKVEFVIKQINKTNEIIDSVLVQDDLKITFGQSKGINVQPLVVSGGLFRNATYDGLADINLVTKNSSLGANKTDSILLTVLVKNAEISGNYNNTANVSAITKYGKINIVSNDPVNNPNGLSNRLATKFVMPKIDVIIPEGFSPNNDGIDDAWTIKKPYGTKLSVKIFNRWGNQLYSNSDYQNDWKGKGVVNFLGEDLPEGTYFYIVEATDALGNMQKFSGPITLMR